MENVKFIQPKREILSPMDMPKWMKSKVEYIEMKALINCLNS